MSQRTLVAVWLLCLIVLRTSFIGQTKASLVVRADVRTIEGMEDLARDPKITPIVVPGSGFLWLLETSETDVFKKVLEKIRSRKAVFKRHDLFSVPILKRILKAKAAMIFTQQPIAGEMKERCSKLGDMDGEFYYAPKLVAQLPMTLFMRKELDKQLRASIGEMIELFIERGLVHKLFRDSGHEETPCLRESALSQQVNTDRSQMDGLRGIFFTWLTGLALAALVLVAEQSHHRCHKATSSSRPKVLRDRPARLRRRGFRPIVLPSNASLVPVFPK
ncbi:uncharacterized protein LOC125943682 [Dermacentor silvarum]|uniref:uncharacterized protein LOC125943682 n=1 Tax=Dermacentor silvarum TaxID=543639 RepID=UPI00210095AE|nr:uncharacterized protein LOC125943682 [Dermacentor silvarum]